jgi:hypothetical protein
MNYTDIMALLSKYSPEEIAESFSKELNAAVKKQEEEKKAKEKTRLTAATNFLSSLNEFFTICYPDSNIEINITAEELLESFDEFIPEMKKINIALNSIAEACQPSTFAAVPKSITDSIASIPKPTIDPIASFLRAYDL